MIREKEQLNYSNTFHVKSQIEIHNWSSSSSSVQTKLLFRLSHLSNVSCSFFKTIDRRRYINKNPRMREIDETAKTRIDRMSPIEAMV